VARLPTTSGEEPIFLSSWTDPWVKGGNTRWLEVTHVARNDNHAVYKRCGSDETVSHGAL